MASSLIAIRLDKRVTIQLLISFSVKCLRLDKTFHQIGNRLRLTALPRRHNQVVQS